MAEGFPSSSPPSPTLDLTIPKIPERIDVNCALDTSLKKKGGRRPKFTAEDDLILARDLLQLRHRFRVYRDSEAIRTGGGVANLNSQLTQKGTVKRVQDRYQKMQEAFDRRDGAGRRLLGG